MAPRGVIRCNGFFQRHYEKLCDVVIQSDNGNGGIGLLRRLRRLARTRKDAHFSTVIANPVGMWRSRVVVTKELNLLR